LLCRWCQVRENWVYAFEKCLDANLGQGLCQAIRDLLTRIRGGMVPDEALALFQQYSPLEPFQDLVLALRFSFRHRGNLPAMLELLEIQQNKLEEARNDRQISNRQDLILTAGLLTVVPLLFAWRLFSSAQIRHLFFESSVGVGLLGVGALCYGAALAGFFRLERRIRQ
jgi:hypothetical protein